MKRGREKKKTQGRKEVRTAGKVLNLENSILSTVSLALLGKLTCCNLKHTVLNEKSVHSHEAPKSYVCCDRTPVGFQLYSIISCQKPRTIRVCHHFQPIYSSRSPLVFSSHIFQIPSDLSFEGTRKRQHGVVVSQQKGNHFPPLTPQLFKTNQKQNVYTAD